MLVIFKAGATAKTIEVFIRDYTQADGRGLAGLAHDTSGLTAYYHREGDISATQIALTTATLGVWTSGGLLEVDAANMPGHYELGIPDAAIASGATYVTIQLKGAASMAPVTIMIMLTAVDHQNATSFGLANIDATVSSRLAPTVAGRALDVSVGGEAGIDWANVGSPTTTLALTGTTISTGQQVASVADKTGYDLTSAARDAIAAAGLTLDWTSVTGEASRSTLNALRALRNKSTLPATSGTGTVYKEDDTTPAWTVAVTTSASAEGVTVVDPA